MTIADFLKKLNYVLCLGLFTIIIGLICFNFLPSPAWAQASYNGTFTLTQACDGTTSIRGSNPIALNIGTSYQAVGLNRPNNPTHVYITVPDTNNRWVALGCGELNPPVVVVVVPDNTQSNGNDLNQTLMPFFDDDPSSTFNSVGLDITPPAPILNEFDLAINRLCGDPGTVVSRADFQATLNQFPTVLANIKDFVGGSLVDGRTADDEFLDDLTDVWFNVHGFDHVFCGEPGRNIGGLHFAGRYLDLQQRGLAGVLRGSESRAEVLPNAVYTLGVVMLVDGNPVSSAIKGYAYSLNAEELLALGAKAYEDNPSTGSTNQVCLVGITDEGNTFYNVFVAREGGIRTFYSDATPDFDRTRECNVLVYETSTGNA
ncbi:hypothetical protein PCC7424_0206 [Gloeothece citriformis PCC 7424]|uniref:Bacterial EndoU nuclease domain-containing protein n=1 Tax=Gloeothece citriformis (strain PCC 7424) TaxID=65393 RepID=B7KAK3_GLOC7|nr:EndoU domain-containing protein [Gloeothece citriformis]ACK68675.1 hypothetical protein PCC7424_0206 [Gloeothece citriformis PCC 7424]